MGYQHGIDWSKWTQEDFQKLMDEHGTVTAAARSLGIEYSSLSAAIARHGVQIHLDRSRRKKKPSILDEHKGSLEQMAASGMNCVEMRDALGGIVAEEQIRRFLRRNEIQLLVNRGAQRGEKHRDWKGGRSLDEDGYILVYAPDHPHATSSGKVREHRLVMEAHLGRYLEPSEVVHHRNDNKQDNRIENLELFATNADHLRETLSGKIPNWTEEGRRRILEANRQRKVPQDGDTLLESETDAQQ